MHIIASLTTAKSIEPMLEHEIRLRATTFMNAAEARRDMRSMIGFKLSTTYYVLRQRGTVGLAVPSKRATYR
jgi:hypothetical protein